MEQQLIRLGLGHHKSGALEPAATAYRKAIISDPVNLQAGNLLGLIDHHLKKHGQALRQFEQVRCGAPSHSDTLNHKAMMLAALSHNSEARTEFQRALITAPQNISILYNLAQAEKTLGDPGRAERCFLYCTTLAPRHFGAWINLASLAISAGRARVAETYLNKAATLDRQHPLFFFEAARLAIFNGTFAQAEACLRACLKIEPTLSEAHNELANILRESNTDTAAVQFKLGLLTGPDMGQLWAGFAAALFDGGDPIRSIKAAKLAVGCQPGSAVAHNNVSKALTDIGRFSEALKSSKQALLLRPDDVKLNYAQSLTSLVADEIARGWTRYCFRRPAQNALAITDALNGFSAAPSALGNGRYLILAEQGVGDEIMFANCFGDIAKRVDDRRIATCLVECDPRLMPLFTRSFPNLEFIPRFPGGSADEAKRHYKTLCAEHDIEHTLLSGSLLGILRPSLDHFPDSPSYLKADPALSAQIQNTLSSGGTGRFRVGIAWRSMNATGFRGTNYPPIEAYEPLFALPDVDFVNLQYHQPEHGLEIARTKFGVDVKIIEGVDLLDDFDASAALIDQLDAVIAPQIATYCLAGALGARCHTVFLGHSWPSFGTTFLPFNPNSRLWTKGPGQSWDELFQKLAPNLAEELKTSAPSHLA